MDKSVKIITSLYEKYKNDKSIINKINLFVEQLPKTLEDTDTNMQIKKLRKDKLTNETDKFINKFMNQKDVQYFYISNTNCFIKYDNQHYTICKEDDLQYHILSSLSKSKQLSSWKHKIKIHILKLIKEKPVFTSIPDSFTIQFVLSKFMNIFQHKDSVKYFLTILGDNILKKSDGVIHFIDPNCKILLKEIAHNCNIYFETIRTPIDSFKFKYHDHDYKQCRLIDIDYHTKINELTLELSKNNYLIDVICVAIHYSNRFSNSDNYMTNFCDNNRLIQRVFYLKDNSQQEIIDQFIENNFRKLERKSKNYIDWKTMLFLWKQYLDFNKLPNIIFHGNLKEVLINKLNYDQSTDCFYKLSNKYFGFLESFFRFWRETITTDNDQEYELKEITQIFKKYSKTSKTRATSSNIQKILNYYYPNTEISDENNILNISCSEWNKNSEIEIFLAFFKSQMLTKDTEYQVSFYDVYNEYCSICRKNSDFIASKKYFEKYIMEHIPEHHISEDCFILSTWWK